MAKTAACPSCGAPVVFKSAASIFAVCEFCQSTLVRHDQQLEDIGKMAALVEDRSPLQLGAEGRWQGLHFAVIGRIQLKYSQGLWNEWHIMFDDMRTGWLSEAGGEYVLTFLKFAPEGVPKFEELTVGESVTLAGRSWEITNFENAECIAGQGELPFKVGPGYSAPVVDMREGDNFATLDYSETPPLFFVGSPVKLPSLKMTNLRDPSAGGAIPEINVQAQVFRCPCCGSPLSVRSADIKSVGCVSCGAVIDTADKNYQILSKALGQNDDRYMPRLELGRKGTLEGAPVEVIGFLVKRTVADGIAYDWREYLLAGDSEETRGTYRWLIESDGHWNLGDLMSKTPRTGKKVQPELKFDNQTFKHFATYQGEVIQVAGEFTWRVARGDKATLTDYVAPPLLLSRETTENESSWTKCAYVEPAAIVEAFKLQAELPEPVGVFANQPNPWEEKHKRIFSLFWKLFLVGLIAHLVFVFGFGGKTLMRQDLVFNPLLPDDTQNTQVFEVRKGGKVVVKNEANLSNNWIGLNMTLVNKQTGQAFSANRELAFYQGFEDGESWSEGARDDEIAFTDVPAGQYYLAVDPDLSPETRTPLRSTVQVSSGGAGWSNWIFLLIYLVVFPIFSRLRRAAFETSRWAESDHAPADDDEDD